ncbi:hypothetical protein LWI29_014232 [Acer saccharum]|uniref:Uncharacterized protein n=1 Tax=Acer saccharum TaxID=4024 RepID=A0AA39SN27_ACESA|nr:hypothetical protein LWI29_014232 [Acer saccharum]
MAEVEKAEVGRPRKDDTGMAEVEKAEVEMADDKDDTGIVVASSPPFPRCRSTLGRRRSNLTVLVCRLAARRPTAARPPFDPLPGN